MNASVEADEYWERGTGFYDAGNIQEAASAWREALHADPGHADLHYNLGVALHESGHQEDAVSHWREAIRLRPDFYEPHYHLICALMEKHEFANPAVPWSELRSLSRAALALNSSSAPQKAYLSQKAYLLRLLGLTEWEVGNKQSAMELIKAAMEVEPGHQWNYEQLGNMQRQTGQWRASWRTARRPWRHCRIWIYRSMNLVTDA